MEYVDARIYGRPPRRVRWDLIIMGIAGVVAVILLGVCSGKALRTGKPPRPAALEGSPTVVDHKDCILLKSIVYGYKGAPKLMYVFQCADGPQMLEIDVKAEGEGVEAVK